MKRLSSTLNSYTFSKKVSGAVFVAPCLAYVLAARQVKLKAIANGSTRPALSGIITLTARFAVYRIVRPVTAAVWYKGAIIPRLADSSASRHFLHYIFLENPINLKTMPTRYFRHTIVAIGIIIFVTTKHMI